MSDDFPLPPGYIKRRELVEKPKPVKLPKAVKVIKKPKRPRPQQLARNPLTYHGRFRPVPGEMSSDMVSNLLNLDKVQQFLSRSPPKDRSRMTALLYTLYTADKVGTIVGMKPEMVRRCYNKHQAELQSAMQARNAMIAGMAERRAIEALQNLDVVKIPDERKPRAVKDLMDSAVLANQNIKPTKAEEDESTMELIFRIKSRGQQNVPRSDTLDDGVIDGELVES